jgi:transposase
MLHRVRELLVRQRKMLINALRAHLAELGIVMRQGSAGVSTLIGLIEDDEHDFIPSFTRRALPPPAEQLTELYRRIADLDRERARCLSHR